MPVAPAFLAVLLMAGPVCGDQRPPRLTFESRVDYVAWYEAFVSRDKRDNVHGLYKSLLGDGSPPRRFPAPEGRADTQMREALRKCWTPRDYPELAAYLQECEPFFDSFRQAAGAGDCWIPAPAGTKLLLQVTLSSAMQTRFAAKALLAQAMLKQDGQAAALTAACRTVLGTARHTRQTGLTISVLDAAGQQVSMYDVTCNALHEGVITTGDALREMYSDIRRYAPGPSSDRADWLIVEWAASLDAIQYICPKGQADRSRLSSYFELLAGETLGEPYAFIVAARADPRATVQLLDKYFQGQVDIVNGPLTWNQSRQLDRFVHRQQPTLKKDVLANAVTGDLTRTYQLLVRTEAMRRGSLLTLAIHAHHARHGQWPTSLDTLDPGPGFNGLRTLRADPFSASSGDFVYRLKDGQPLLYSVADGKNDGGRHDPKWREGTDYIFWPYQP